VIYHHRTTGIADSYNLSDLESTVRAASARLRSVADTFDSIVVTGMSGVLVGAPLSLRLKKPLVVIRKDNDNTHQYDGRVGGTKLINLTNLGQRALFLDDFTSSGETRKRVVEKIREAGSSVVQEYYYDHDELI
jgi:adenine/guanine phosphoribosyltransferase-like PRPP-binding protein